MYYCRQCGFEPLVIDFGNNDVICYHCKKRVIPMDIDEEGCPITIYASKKEYLETHFEYYYTWVCENFDTDDIEEDELKIIVESAILKQLDGYTNDKTIKVSQLYEDCDEYQLYIIDEIEDRLNKYFESK
jgi:hypothetical protein